MKEVSDIFEKNVILINLPSVTQSTLMSHFESGDILFAQLHGEPLGLCYLSAYAKMHGVVRNIGLVDFALGLKESWKYRSIEHYIESYLESEDERLNICPEVIGISINYTPSHFFLTLASKVLKKKWPKAKIIVGGFHATNAINEILKLKSIDYVVRGQGEIAFTDILKTDLKDDQILTIQGVYSKVSYNQVLNSENKLKIAATSVLPSAKIIENLDDLPFPDREILDMETYSREQGRATSLEQTFSRLKASIITTRGCYFACTFCASRTIFPQKMQYRSIDNVIHEIRTLREQYCINFLILEDDLFTANRKTCIEILRAIAFLKASEMPDLEIQFPNDLNVNTTDSEIFDLMIECGLRVAHIAVESGSRETQHRIINKRADLDKVKPHVSYLQGKGIIVKCVYILGFPRETKELMEQTIKFARSVEADWSIFNIATPLLGTPMYDQFYEMGVIDGGIEFLAEVDFRRRHFNTPEISADDLNELQYKANLEVNFVNNVNLRNGNWNQALRLFEEISAKYPFHIFSHYALAKTYRALELNTKSRDLQKSIESLRDNQAARTMYEKYGALVADFEEVLGISQNFFRSSKASVEVQKLVVF